jgi:hypothetical protein
VLRFRSRDHSRTLQSIECVIEGIERFGESHPAFASNAHQRTSGLVVDEINECKLLAKYSALKCIALRAGALALSCYVRSAHGTFLLWAMASGCFRSAGAAFVYRFFLPPNLSACARLIS